MTGNKTIEPDVSDLEQISSLPVKLRRDITRHLEKIVGYRPTIALFGKTGVGKSSLGNAMFGKEVFPVSSVRAGTREPSTFATAILGADLDLVDFPGVGESKDRDEEYRELYRTWIERIDVALWVIKMDDRVLSPDIDYFENVLKPAKFPINRIIFVISQVDKSDPYREWDIQHAKPSEKQLQNINERINIICEQFDVRSDQVVAVSSEERYNLKELAGRIILACPANAALNLAKALNKDVRSERLKKSVVQRVMESVSSFYNQNSELINNVLFGLFTRIISKRLG